MSTGPLRRMVGTCGLVALSPTAVMLAQDVISPADAGRRAVATLAAATVLGRVATWWLSSTATTFERSAPGEEDDASPAAERRASPPPS